MNKIPKLNQFSRSVRETWAHTSTADVQIKTFWGESNLATYQEPEMGSYLVTVTSLLKVCSEKIILNSKMFTVR